MAFDCISKLTGVSTFFRPGHGNDSEAEEWSMLKIVRELKQCWRRCLSLCCYVGAVILILFLVDNTQR